MNDWIKAILGNGAVWSAFLLMANTLAFYFIPAFPKEVWASINGFIIAMLAASGVSVVKQQVKQIRAAR